MTDFDVFAPSQRVELDARTQQIVLIPASQQVVLDVRTQRIELNPVTQAVSVVSAGPVGPPGFATEDEDFYEHQQTVASTSWVINHNLGFHPNIDVRDETGRRLRPAIIHHTVNQSEVQCLTPRIGTATCS
jgi:hypothetical protein